MVQRLGVGKAEILWRQEAPSFWYRQVLLPPYSLGGRSGRELCSAYIESVPVGRPRAQYLHPELSAAWNLQPKRPKPRSGNLIP